MWTFYFVINDFFFPPSSRDLPQGPFRMLSTEQWAGPSCRSTLNWLVQRQSCSSGSETRRHVCQRSARAQASSSSSSRGGRGAVYQSRDSPPGRTHASFLYRPSCSRHEWSLVYFHVTLILITYRAHSWQARRLFSSGKISHLHFSFFFGSVTSLVFSLHTLLYFWASVISMYSRPQKNEPALLSWFDPFQFFHRWYFWSESAFLCQFSISENLASSCQKLQTITSIQCFPQLFLAVWKSLWSCAAINTVRIPTSQH